jgi:very-short-patch-repair endonuclease
MRTESVITYKEREVLRDIYKQQLPIEEIISICRYILFKLSPIEEIVWGEIKSLYYTKYFVPQYPILNYFADFACLINRIVIECDSLKYHTNKQKDIKRQIEIESQGWEVIRFNSRQIYCNLYDKILTEYDKGNIEEYEIQKLIDINANNCVACYLRSTEFKYKMKYI